MFANTNNVYASAKHLAITGMCVDPDMLVFNEGINFNAVNIIKIMISSTHVNISLKHGGETDEKYRNPE